MEKNKDNNKIQYEKEKEQLKKMNEKVRGLRKSKDKTNSSQSKRDNFQRNMKITFENIEKMHFSEFNNKGEDDFKP